MGVTATFCVNISSDDCIDEEQLNTEFESNRPKIIADERRHGAINGAIVIRSPQNPDIRVEDELEAVVQNVCFLALPDLLAGKRVIVPYFRYPGEIELKPEGHQLLMSGEAIPEERLELREAVFAFYECGQRVVSFLRRLRSDGAESAESEDAIRYLEGKEKVARQALLAEHLLSSIA